MVQIISAEQLQKVHEAITKKFGVSKKAKNPGILGFTLSYLKTGDEDLLFKTAVLLRNIAVNKPFEELNLETALIAADCQLRLNGWYMKTVPEVYIKNIQAKSLQDIAKTIDINLAKEERIPDFDEILRVSLGVNFNVLRRLA